MGCERLQSFDPVPYLKDISEVSSFASKYGIPFGDVVLIGLNLSGIHYQDVENDRGRFDLTLKNGKSFRLALTVTSSKITNFSHDGEKVLLNGFELGSATEVEKDTCTDTYWRGKNNLTLNSNMRSLCKGCNFCGTYSLTSREDSLVEEGALEKEVIRIMPEKGSYEDVEKIGIVTGCFPSESTIVKHIKDVRRIFSKYGFNGEINYIGSQIRSKEALMELVNDGPFTLSLTLEIFSRREELMKKQKASLTLEGAKEILARARQLGAETNFLYILGLDPLDIFEKRLPEFSDLVTRLPQFQTFQLYTPDQVVYRDPEASTLDYYLAARKIAESVFPDKKPILDLNYRGLWYGKYNGSVL